MSTGIKAAFIHTFLGGGKKGETNRKKNERKGGGKEARKEGGRTKKLGEKLENGLKTSLKKSLEGNPYPLDQKKAAVVSYFGNTRR